MTDETLVRVYRKRRQAGLPALAAWEAARYEVAAPRWEFLAELKSYGGTVSGTVGPFDVAVTVHDDDLAQLGDDDVTGTFTDVEEPGVTVPNRTSGYNGAGCKYYRPSNYRRQYSYDEARAAGMSKAVARSYVAKVIAEDMRDDASRQWFGVTVTVSVGGREIGGASLWGIDITDDFGSDRYLRSVAEELIGEAIGEARERCALVADEVDDEARRMVEQLPARLADLARLAATLRAVGEAPDPSVPGLPG